MQDATGEVNDNQQIQDMLDRMASETMDFVAIQHQADDEAEELARLQTVYGELPEFWAMAPSSQEPDGTPLPDTSIEALLYTPVGLRPRIPIAVESQEQMSAVPCLSMEDLQVEWLSHHKVPRMGYHNRLSIKWLRDHSPRFCHREFFFEDPQNKEIIRVFVHTAIAVAEQSNPVTRGRYIAILSNYQLMSIISPILFVENGSPFSEILRSFLSEAAATKVVQYVWNFYQVCIPNNANLLGVAVHSLCFHTDLEDVVRRASSNVTRGAWQSLLHQVAEDADHYQQQHHTAINKCMQDILNAVGADLQRQIKQFSNRREHERQLLRDRK
ncbi:unnamed protein product, partial [Mesorhabditis spiculigera]